MKRLKLDNLGGMPFDQDDLAWMQDATKEEIIAFVKPFRAASSGVMIITGCVASAAGADVNITPGTMLIDDELCFYAGETVPSGSLLTPQFNVGTQHDSSGDETYQDSSVHQTYEEKYAVLFQTPGVNSQLAYINIINSLPQLRHAWQFNSVIEDWKAPVVNAPALTPALSFSPGADTPLQYRKMEGNRVELAGSFSHTAAASGVIATLPVGYRPNKRVYLPMLRVNNAGISDYLFSLRVDTDGSLRIGNNTNLLNADEFCVDGLSFPLERGV